MQKSELQNAVEIFAGLRDRAGGDEAQRLLYQGLLYLAEGMMNLDAKVEGLRARISRGD